MIKLSVATTIFAALLATPAFAGYGSSSVSNTITNSWGSTKTVANIDVNNLSTGTRQGVEGDYAKKTEWFGDAKSGVRGDISTGSYSNGTYSESYRNTEVGNVKSITEADFDSFSIEASGY
jgi:hypothetical protein